MSAVSNALGNVIQHTLQPCEVNRFVVALEGRQPTPSKHLSLEDYFLEETTQAFMSLEKTLLESLVRVCEEKDTCSVEELIEAQIARDMIKTSERMLEQSQEHFTVEVQGFRDFMKNEESLNAWHRSKSVFRAIFRRKISGKGLSALAVNILNDVKEMVSCARVISKQLEAAEDKLQLEPETKNFFRVRWTYLQDIIRVAGEEVKGGYVPVPPWSEISELIRTGPTQTQDPLSESSSTSQLSNTTSILWLTALVTLVTIPTAGRAWQYSDHKPGTTKQADFWYLLQNCSMTLLNLATLGIPIWRRKALPRQSWIWTWGFIAIAVACAIVAPVIYIFVPTEWSAYMAIVAGIIQVFVTLQIALVADSAGAKVIKND